MTSKRNLCWLWRRCARVDKVAMFDITFRYRLIVKFDTYRNLTRHRAVLPAIALLISLNSNLNLFACLMMQKVSCGRFYPPYQTQHTGIMVKVDVH